MAKDEFWANDAPAEPSVPAESGGDFWLSDKPAAQQELPAGVKPSTAGAGRGNVSPERVRTAPAGLAPVEYGLSDVSVTPSTGPAVQPARPESVLQSAPMTRNSERRISLGAGPISQNTAARAEQLVDGQLQDQNMLELRAALGIQDQRAAGSRETFGDVSARATLPDRMREAGAEMESQQRRDFAEQNPILGGMASGSAGLLAGTLNVPQVAADGFNKTFVDPVLRLAGQDPMPVPGKTPGTDNLIRMAADFAPVVGQQEMGAAWDKGEFAPWLVANMAQQSPQIAQSLVAAFAPPLRAVLLPGMGAQAAGSSYIAGDDPRVAIAKGAVEIGTEMLPLQAFDKIGGLLAKLPAGAQKAVLAEAGKRVMAAGGAVTANMLTNAIEETVAQVSGNALDRYVSGKNVELTHGADAAAVLGAAAGGGMSAPQAARALVKPTDRTPQIKSLREAGDETAATLLEQRQQKEQAAYTAEVETEAIADFGPEVQQRYRETRLAGMKTGDAVVQTAARWNFEQAAQLAGLSPKAQEVIAAKLAEIPPEKAAGFVQKAITGLVQAGHGQAFEGMESLAQNIEAQRDQMLDAVLSGAIQPTTPTEANSATEETTATAADTQGVAGAPAGDPAALGGDQPGAVSALSDNNDVLVTPELDAVHAAATSPLNDLPEPTQAQKDAGNYKLGKIRMSGMDISIENPQGSARSGVDTDGKEWTTPMRDHYGYFRGTTAADGDKLDVFIKPGTPQDFAGTVFVVDQIDPSTGKFDEAKVVFGAADQQEAEAIYRRNYTADWQGFGAITALPMDQFKAWAKSDQTRNPLGALPTPTNVQDAPQGTGQTGEFAQAAPVEAPAPEGGDAAADMGIPTTGAAGDVQADGVDLLGRNSQPMRDGGKPFKTQAEAQKEKKLHPTMRVVKSPDGKGFVLKPMSEKQISAIEKAAKRLKGVATGEAGPMSLHYFILSRGGLSRDSMADAGFDANQRIGNRWLFSNTGLTLAKMSEALKEAGFITEETENAVTEGLRRSLVNPVYTPEGYEAMAQAEAETRYEDHLAAQQESEEDPFATLTDDVFTPEDFDGTGFDQASPDIQAEVAALAAHLETIGQDVDSIRERVALQYPDASEQEYHEHLKAAITAAIAEAAQPAGRGDFGQVDGEQDQAREGSTESLTDRPDGTLSVKGDTAGLKQRLTTAGIPAKSILPSATGVVVGKTQAAKAREVLETEPASTYINGDRAEYTGKTETLHGGLFYEVRYTEGPKSGKTAVTQRAPDGTGRPVNMPKSTGIKTPQIVPEKPDLTAPTKADIEAQQARAEQAARDKAAADRAAERAAAQDEDRKRIAKASEQAADTFELGGDAMANLTGQKDIFGDPDPEPAVDDAKQKAADDLKSALGDLGDIFGKNFRASIAPEQEQKLLPVLSRVMDAAFRLGYLKFKDAAKFTLDKIREALGADVADAVTIDHLQGAYIAMSGKYKDQGADTKKAVVNVEDKAEVEAHTARADNSATQENSNAPSTDARMERDRSEPGPVGAMGDAVPGNGRGTAGAAGETGGQTDRGEGGGQPNLARVQADGTTAGGKRGDQLVLAGDGPATDARISSGADFGERGPDIGIEGVPPETIPASEVAGSASSGDADLTARAKQRAADKTPIKTGDIENIRSTLPYLLEGQQDDVQMAEKQFAKDDGYGMLFTNGTGTGKTFSGLGVVKRFARQGKTNTLIVVPDDKIAADWIESARALGLTVTRLDSTKDAGRDIAITTYANLGDNDQLATRGWDLVVADEAHMLMQSADGKMTGYLQNLRAITMNPLGTGQRYEMLNREDINAFAELTDRIAGNIKILNNTDTMDAMMTATRAENEKLQAKADKLAKKLREALDATRAEVKAAQGAKRTRAVFLSATPFAYEKTIDWANGYLFDYNEGREAEGTRTRSYNEGDNREQFFMQHFGYTMRYNKLNSPDPRKVDTGLMQRQFNGWLKKRGSLAGRMLDVKADYDRRFVLVESAVGNQIDGAIEWIEQRRKAHYETHKDKKGNEAPPNGYDYLQNQLNETLYGKTGHLLRRYLLEAIKAKEVIPLIRQHMALGRKVVVFHDFKKGGAVNPFAFSKHSEQVVQSAATSEDRDDMLAKKRAYNAAVTAFNAEFPDLSSGTLLSDLASPIDRFKREFDDVLLINGDEKKSDLLQRYKTFNDDAKGPAVALVQSAKNKGWSGHDTTGKHQRVLFNLGLPTQPTMSIQQEGRIYRTGQVTNAIMRYLNTGTNWERWAFAQTISERASAAENLGMGELARALKDGFISAFEESDTYPPGHEGEGTGGKERDKAANNALSEWDRAKSFYWGTQKKNSRTKAQEGTDYFATPEPVGLKMVEWLALRGSEDSLEPSGGHGAIARWLPDTTRRTVIEPSSALRSRLAMVMNPAEDRILDGQFEDLDIVNKFDGIAMNPPFGSGGKTAIEHVAKAATHLRDGGRIVALIPTGPAADKRFEKWFYETEQRPMKAAMKHPKLGDIYVGDTLTTNAAWAQKGIVMSASDRVVTLKVEGLRSGTGVAIEAVTAVEPTGKRTREVRPADGLYMVADIKLPQVTFERAGTAVATRIVVIEKQTDAARAPGQARNIDLSDAKEIVELFDRLEDMGMQPRAMTKAQEDAAKAEEAAPRQPERTSRTAAAKPEKPAKAEVVPTVDRQGAEIVEHTTTKGKVIRGIIRKDLTKEQAQEIDPYTWKKDGGYFIREKYLKPDTEFQRLDDGTQAGDTAADGNQDTRPEARINVGMLGRDIARYLDRAGEETSVRPYDARVLTGYGELQSIAEAFGSEVQGFGMRVGLDADAHKRYGFFGGVRTSGVVFLRDTGGDRPHLSVLGHELGHELRSRRPDLYDQLVDAIRPYVNVGKYEAEFVNSVVVKNQTSPDKKQEEFIGEVLSDGFMDPDFWRALGRKNQSLLQYVGNAIFDLIEKALKALGYTKRSAPYLTDYKAVMRIAGEVMAEFGVAPRGARGDLDFQTISGTIPPGQQALPVTGTMTDPVPLPEDTLPRRIQRRVQDQYNRFTVIRNWAKEQGMNLSKLSDVWEFEERMHGRMATRIEDFREKRVQPLIEKIQKAGFSMADVGEYLHAQHAEERNAQILKIDPMNPTGSGMETADARAILSAADPKLAALANEFRAITDDTRDVLLQAGIISGEMVKAWSDAYQHYVPLKGGDEDTPATGTGKGLSVKATNKRAMGHGQRAEFIIENIMRDHERAIMLAEKNLVGHSLLSMVIELGRSDIATFGQPERRKVLKNRTEFEVVGRNGAVVGTFDTQQAANAFIVTQNRTGLTVRSVKGDPVVGYMASPMLAENEVQVYAKGQTVRIQLNDPLLARAYKKLGVENLTKMMQVNREVNNFLSKAYTGYNPEFFFKNILRDFTAGMINITGQEGARLALKAAADYPRAFGQMLRYSYTGTASPSIAAYRAAGGSTGAAYLGDIERIGADIQASYEEYQGAIQLAKDGRPGTAAKVAGKKLVKKLVGFMEHLNAAGENAMRLAVFDALRTEPGRSIHEAASLAKNATVNFNRKGEIGAQANALYLFFNAATQGTAATMSALVMGKHKHQAQAVAGALGLLAYSLAALQFGGDDEEDRKAWAKIPDNVKDRNLVIRTGPETYITLAIPYGYGYFFTLGNAMFDLQRGGDTDKIALKLTSGILEHFGPAINPLGGEELDARSMVEVMPGAFGGELMRAGARLLVNRSSFGNDIVPDSTFDEGKPDNQRMFRTTKGTGYEKVAATLNQISGGTKSQPGWVDVSPESVKFWTETITGGAGKFVMDVANTGTLMAAKVGDDENADALTPELREIPLARTLVRKQDIRDARRLYWEAVKEAEAAQKGFERAEEMNDDTGMVGVVERDGYLLSLGKSIEKSNEAIKQLRDNIDMINSSEDYSRGEKRMLIKELEKVELAIYDGMIELFADVKKPKP